MVQKIGGKTIEIFSYSRLMVGQVRGELEARDTRMQGYLSKVRSLQSGFKSFNLQHIHRNGNTNADSLATLATSLTQSLRVILVEDLCKPTEMMNEAVHIHQIRWALIGWTLQCYSLRRISCPRRKQRLTRCEERLIGFGCLMTKNCTNTLFLGHTYYAYTQKYQSYSQRSYMKEFVKATQEASPCLTEPSLRDIGGRIYRRKHRSM